MPCNIATNYAIHCTRGIAERLFFWVKNMESVKHGQLRKTNSCNLAPFKTKDFYSWDHPSADTISIQFSCEKMNSSKKNLVADLTKVAVCGISVLIAFMLVLEVKLS